MKTFKVENQVISLYSLEDLATEAREKAIEEHRNFLLSVMKKEDFISGDPQYDTEEQLEDMYNKEYECIEENNEPVIESIEINEYLFFYDGTMAACTTYCVKHEKAGLTECKYNGKKYAVA